MESNEELDLRRTEELLRQFAPRPVNIDRERLMYLAGQAEAQNRDAGSSLRDRWRLLDAKGLYWPLAALAMSGVAATLAIALALQLGRPPQERIVVREVPVAAPQQTDIVQATPPRDVHPSGVGRTIGASVVPGIPLSLPTSSVFQMRNTALRFGVEALPKTPNANPPRSPVPSAWGHFHELREVEAATKSP